MMKKDNIEVHLKDDKDIHMFWIYNKELRFFTIGERLGSETPYEWSILGYDYPYTDSDFGTRLNQGPWICGPEIKVKDYDFTITRRTWVGEPDADT